MTFTHLAIAHSPLSPSNPISQVNSVMLDFFLYAVNFFFLKGSIF